MSSKTHNTMYEEYEEKLWKLERERDQLRAELERLKKEAHDKHWPLANACRNLLPHSDEDNVTQVWAASRKIEQLCAEVEQWKQKYNNLNELVENAGRLTMKADLIAREEMDDEE